MNDSAGIAHVIQLVTPVRLELLEGAVSAPVGARVNLECRAYARPDPHVTWLFGDRSRVSSPLLSVHNVSISHSGTYRCSASHERCARLVAESDVTVNVFESTIRTNEGFPGSGITLTPGADSLRLLCDYPADRSAKIVWLKENATVPSGGKYTYDKKDQSLVIRKPERGDVGNYSCVALGRIVNETAMIVVGLKVEIHTSQSKHFKQGHDGFLSCKVDGYPTPTIRWYRNGHLLNAFKSSKFKYGGKRADDYGTLVIRRLGKHDEATFACLVDNGHSQDRAFFPVVVSVPSSPLVPFFVICAEVALLTVIAFLFENNVRNAWMAARRMTAPKGGRTLDRDAGRKRKSCTESDILRFISCLESSGDLDVYDLREPDPDEMPLTKRAVNAVPAKSAFLTRDKVTDVSAEPHVAFRPSENTVKVMVEPLEESAPEGVAAVEVSPDEDNISPRKKSRKKKSQCSSRKSRLSRDDSVAASVQEFSSPQATELEKPISTTSGKERVPKLYTVVEETLPMPMAVQDSEPLSQVSTGLKLLPATEQNEEAVSKASKVDKACIKQQTKGGLKVSEGKKISHATAQKEKQMSQLSNVDDDILHTAAQGKKLVPQTADVEAQNKAIPRFAAIPTVEVPTGTNARAKMKKDAESPAVSSLSRTKAKAKQTTKEPITALPAGRLPCTDIVPLVQETEKLTPVRKGSLTSQGIGVKKRMTARELAADNASRSSLDDFMYRKDSLSSRIVPSELFKDNTDRGPAVRQAVANGTKHFLYEEEPCGWKLSEGRVVEYTEPGSVVLVNEGAVSGIPTAEGDTVTRRISFTRGTKQEDSSGMHLGPKGKKRKGWLKKQNEGEPLPGSPDERSLPFGVHTSAKITEMMTSIHLSNQRDEAEKAGLVEYYEDTKVEGWLKDRKKPPEGPESGCLTSLDETGGYPSMSPGRPVLPNKEASLQRRDTKAAQALPVQKPIPSRPEEKPVSCLPESELILRSSHQAKPVAKKQEHESFTIASYKHGTESPSTPPSPEEVTVRGRTQSCIKGSVTTERPSPSTRKSDHLSEHSSETESTKESAEFAALIRTSEEPDKKSSVPPTAQAKRLVPKIDKVPVKALASFSTPDKGKPTLDLDEPPRCTEIEEAVREEQQQKKAPPENTLSRTLREVFSRRASRKKDEPTNFEAVLPKSAVAERMVPKKEQRDKVAPGNISTVDSPKGSSRRTSGQKVEPTQKIPGKLVPIVESSECALTESPPTGTLNVLPPPAPTISLRSSERMVEPIKKTLPAAMPKETMAEKLPTKTILPIPARKSSDQKSYKEVIRAPDKIGPLVALPARIVGDSTSTEMASSDGNLPHVTESEESRSWRTSDTVKSTMPEKLHSLVEVQDRTVSEVPFSESPVSRSPESATLQEVSSRRTSSDGGDALKPKTPEKPRQLVEAKDSTIIERPSSESAVSESTVIEVKSPVAAQRTLRKRSSQGERAFVEQGARNISERKKCGDSMNEITDSDRTVIEKRHHPPALERHVDSRVAGTESGVSSTPRIVSKREGSSTEGEQRVTEEQMYEGLHVPDYQRSLSPSESEYEPPMPSELFNSTMVPELDWTQDPDNFYYLSIPPFEFAIPRSHVDAPGGGSPPETEVKEGNARHRSSRRRRHQHRHKSSTHDGSSSGTFTPSLALDAEVDFLDQSSAYRYGQASEDGASISRDEPSRREEGTSSQNRRVQQHKSKTRQQKK
ncbi:uncharacterized protein LOC142795101 [Rhipicephalus microplus]|uniref:uncharacterized protein LOC142795101 n=1 Tax=Rhipicephalus microplus TaxID=6941 RepID=UPI003F6A7CF8